MQCRSCKQRWSTAHLDKGQSRVKFQEEFDLHRRMHPRLLKHNHMYVYDVVEKPQKYKLEYLMKHKFCGYPWVSFQNCQVMTSKCLNLNACTVGKESVKCKTTFLFSLIKCEKCSKTNFTPTLSSSQTSHRD